MVYDGVGEVADEDHPVEPEGEEDQEPGPANLQPIQISTKYNNNIGKYLQNLQKLKYPQIPSNANHSFLPTFPSKRRARRMRKRRPTSQVSKALCWAPVVGQRCKTEI